MNPSRFYILIFFISLFLEQAATAAEQPVRLNADRLVYNANQKELTLLGNIKISYHDVILSGDRAVFNTDTKKGSVLGNIKITQPGTNLTGNRMNVDYAGQIASIEGSVRITTVRNIAAGESGGVTAMTADRISYNWQTREGDAAGNIEVTQGDRRVYANKAHYGGSSEIITLSDNVRIEQGSNNWITSSKAIVDIRKNTYMVTGGVKGNFLINVNTGGQKAGAAPSPTGAGAENQDKIPIKPPPFEEKKIP